MKMKGDPPTEDARAAKRAASAWIENTVQNKSRKASANKEQVRLSNTRNNGFEDHPLNLHYFNEILLST